MVQERLPFRFDVELWVISPLLAGPVEISIAAALVALRRGPAVVGKLPGRRPVVLVAHTFKALSLVVLLSGAGQTIHASIRRPTYVAGHVGMSTRAVGLWGFERASLSPQHIH